MSQKQAVTDTVQEINPPDGFDTQRRFVRVTSHRADGFIEFDFAIGEPELFVELVLEPPAFEEFCRTQHACVLASADLSSEAQDGSRSSEGSPERDDWNWRIHDATHTRFR